jgi:Transcriptional regulator
MNLQQLEYIVAVDTHRHFVKAADSCFVTQATLSMMIKKLEEELGVKIFDRSKVPVIPTDVGKAIIDQARIVLKEAKQLEQVVQQQKGQLSGDLRMAIIPTLAPFLLPLFLPRFFGAIPAGEAAHFGNEYRAHHQAIGKPTAGCGYTGDTAQAAHAE